MKKNLLIWGTAIVLIITAIFVVTNNGNSKAAIGNSSSQSAAVQDSNLPYLGKAIDFKLKDLDGNDISLSNFKGKNVYLNFFATWCPPCRAEMPEIEKVYQKYKDKDFVVLAVDLGEDKDSVKTFIENNNYSFKAVLDSDQSVAEKYNISAIPVSIFIDKNGNIIAKKVGAMSSDEMEQYVGKLVDKK